MTDQAFVKITGKNVVTDLTAIQAQVDANTTAIAGIGGGGGGGDLTALTATVTGIQSAVNATLATPSTVATPTLSTSVVTAADGTVSIELVAAWTAVTDTNFGYYEVDLRETISGTFFAYTTRQPTFKWAVKGNVTYYVQVRAVSTGGTPGAYSPLANVTTPLKTSAPGAATGLTAVASLRAVLLSWTAPSDNDVAYTVIRQGSLSDGTDGTPIGRTSGTLFSVTGLTTGTTYYFSVQPVNTSGVGAGSWGTIAGATMPAVPSSDIISVTAPQVTGLLTDTQLQAISASKLAGQVTNAQIADLASTKITGTLADAQIAALSASKVTGTLSDSQLAAISAAKITGTLTNSQIADVAAVKVTGTLTDAQLSAIASTKITGTLTDTQLAAISAAKITGTLTNSQIADVAAAKVTGTLTDTQLAAISASKITGQITTTQITDNSISTAKIAAGAVVAASIAADTITAAQIAAGAITASELAAGAVVAGKITAGTIVAADIAANTITASQIASATIVAANIAADTITAGQIAANAITSSELAAGAVIAGKITAGTIVAADIAANTITASQIAANTITASQIAANTITASQIAANTITSGQILAGTITATQIASATILAANIAADTITAAQIAAGAITSSELAAGAVIAGKISAGTIQAGDIAAGTITGDRIAANTISASKVQITSVSESIVQNGDFEDATVGQIPNGWYIFDSTGTGFQFYAESSGAATFHTSGSSYAVLNRGGTTSSFGVAGAGPLAPCVPGAQYEVSVFARASAGSSTNGMYLRVRWYTNTGTYISDTDAIADGPIPASITTIAGVATAPSNAAFAQGVIYHWVGSTVQYMIIDQYRLVRVIGTTRIADGTITTAKIVASAITANEIAAGTITAAKIAANTITASQIAANTITAGQIASATITATQIAANTITASQIAANTITASQIAAGTIGATQISVSSLSALSSNLGTVTTGLIQSASGGVKISLNSDLLEITAARLSVKTTDGATASNPFFNSSSTLRLDSDSTISPGAISTTGATTGTFTPVFESPATGIYQVTTSVSLTSGTKVAVLASFSGNTGISQNTVSGTANIVIDGTTVYSQDITIINDPSALQDRFPAWSILYLYTTSSTGTHTFKANCPAGYVGSTKQWSASNIITLVVLELRK